MNVRRTYITLRWLSRIGEIIQYKWGLSSLHFTPLKKKENLKKKEKRKNCIHKTKQERGKKKNSAIYIWFKLFNNCNCQLAITLHQNCSLHTNISTPSDTLKFNLPIIWHRWHSIVVQTNLVWWVSGYVGFLVFWVKFLKPKAVSHHLWLNKSGYVGSGYVGKSGYMGEEFVDISKNDLAMWVKGQGQCHFSSLCLHFF